MDWLNEGLTRSIDFFNAHGLASLAAALPRSLTLDEAAQSKAAVARQAGLTGVFVFPPYKLLQEQTQALVRELANAPSDSLPAPHQYSESWVQDINELAACAARNRGDSAYILLYSPTKFPEDTRNLTADQLDKLFAENNWTGLAAHEYLVLQRVYSEINGDHRFDDYVSDTQRSQWMWLLDSRVPKGVVMGYWNPAKKRVELGWCKANNKNEKRGSHPTVVIPV